MRRGAPHRDWLPPALSGALLALAFPPFELLVPPFVGLVPFLAYCASLPPGPAGRRAAARGGLILGVAYYGILLHWLAAALSHVSRLALPAYAVVVLGFAAFPAVFGAALHLILERTRVPLAIAAALAWTAMEWVQGHLGPFSFPWLGLGTALAPYPRVAGAADLVGSGGLTFWLVLVNGLIAGMVGRAAISGVRGRAAPAAAAALVATLAAPMAYGAWRVATLEMHAAASVALIQPNVELHVKRDPALALDSSMTALERLTRTIKPGSAELVIWPEVAVPAVLDPGDADGTMRRVRALAVDAGAPILAGTYGRAGQGSSRRFNSAMLVEPHRPATATYHKRHLVPFFEHIPLLPATWSEWLAERDARYASLLPGPPASPPMKAGQARFGVLICFESAFQDVARRHVNAGANFLVNITNDAWLGGTRLLPGTGGFLQHPAHLALRAIELRKGIARAANTGFSMAIDPLGRVHDRSTLAEPAAYTIVVLTTDERTLFARTGAWLPAVCAAATAALLLASRRRADRVFSLDRVGR